MTTPNLPPVKIAFVIDGVVADVLHTDDRLASIFLSEPKIVDVTAWIDANPNTNLVNATYDGTEFTVKEPSITPYTGAPLNQPPAN